MITIIVVGILAYIFWVWASSDMGGEEDEQ